MIRLSLVLAASLMMLGGCDSGQESAAQRVSAPDDDGAPPLPGEIVRTEAGTPIPAMTFTDPSGAELDTADLGGTPVLLNLWATWCAPCVVEMPMLDALAAEMDGKLKVLTISQDVRGAELVEPFFAQRDFQYLEPWLDEDADLSAALNDSGLMPLTVLFDAQGREVFRVAGGYEWDSEEAVAEISEELAASSVSAE
ncbi:TlpA family protein disulfide reductase [Erythrobacter sp. MTPC3]|uniref:TlpA family protein disulfide reductase n=1 Tax=Erythrobacter sp. MTPC3 TaxID=3056564 RepID=UPI0036F37A0D